MSQDVSRIAPALPAPGTTAAPDLDRLAELATEFESMLLGQMLREMRKAGSWKDESEDTGLGGNALFDAIDVELALRLSKAQSLGFRDQLLRQVSHGQVTNGQVPKLPAVAGLAPATTEPLALSPVVTSGFGWRQDPLTGAAAFHRGIDLRAAYGATVAAAGTGRVVAAREEGGYGNTVVVDHGQGLKTRYAHLSAITVAVGDQVSAGTQVGLAGRSGRATGTHVHFEATLDGRPLNPGEVPDRLKSGAPDADVETGRSESWRRP